MMKKIAIAASVAAGLAVTTLGVAAPASAHGYRTYHYSYHHSYHRPHYVYRYYAPVQVYSVCHAYGWKVNHYGHKYWGCIW